MRTQDEIQTWRQGADHYAKLAGEHTDASCQLACLILADYCVYQWSGDHGGPHQEMVQLAEKILGISAGAPSTPPAQQSEQDLRQRILESLIIYQDRAQQYLRFCPIDAQPFRHGLSLNIKLGDNHTHDREIVANYLVKCVEVLTDERTAQEP